MFSMFLGRAPWPALFSRLHLRQTVLCAFAFSLPVFLPLGPGGQWLTRKSSKNMKKTPNILQSRHSTASIFCKIVIRCDFVHFFSLWKSTLVWYKCFHVLSWFLKISSWYSTLQHHLWNQLALNAKVPLWYKPFYLCFHLLNADNCVLLYVT